ncbi:MULTISPECIES: very short patch repair endonuclease [unclassified Janthinobacterium]|uniref:very short patch repair endonuclease n=1 Tax=unclassified Janthinobacterium TaxID=2610881 RepID=UPI000379D04F|nr:MULTISPECIES: very short patch repair endonuclease [unclassified Janthinobacterium]MEC5163135.1 DNA mismatch endonuclease (patch repair protein) [Janthinobacterium sp. CG_S6]
MVDTVDVATRSDIMSCVRSKNTGPEMLVRRLVFAAGYRYRLHGKKLPGKPDLVFAGRRKVIFVHGCFWHLHAGCLLGARIPKSRVDFWTLKLEGNRRRDEANRAALAGLGWKVLTLWECELADHDALRAKVFAFLDGPG